MSEEQCDVTVLVCTYNRAQDLDEAIASALDQDTGGEIRYEVLVVDNNSTDSTRDVAEAWTRKAPDRVRYFFEGQAGKSNALNTGLQHARGEIYFVVDDDILLPSRSHLRDLAAVFRTHPDVSFVGGKVLPLYRKTAPAWLDQRHWAAIAMCDYGEREIYSDSTNPICLLSGAFRTADALAVGGYRPLSVSEKMTGGVEDVDLYNRLIESGRRGLYVPHLSVSHKVETVRLEKAYHRRWHTGHGRFYARMRDTQMERSGWFVAGVPGHLLRTAAGHARGWLRESLRGDSAGAFYHETQLRFFAGFARERAAERFRGKKQ